MQFAIASVIVAFPPVYPSATSPFFLSLNHALPRSPSFPRIVAWRSGRNVARSVAPCPRENQPREKAGRQKGKRKGGEGRAAASQRRPAGVPLSDLAARSDHDDDNPVGRKRSSLGRDN